MNSSESTRTLVAILTVVALAVAFWILLLGPKRETADELGLQVEQLQTTLAQTQSTVVAGEESRKAFPTNYQQLVVLGKAVPVGDESASLLVQLNQIADRAHVSFRSLQVGTSNSSEVTESAPPEVDETEGESEESGSEESSAVAAAAIEPTESAASALPIGATLGTAGLSVLPYDLRFKGSFFHVADFINGVDSLIKTSGSKLAVDGRLVTLDGFTLSADSEKGFPYLEANFSVTTYLVPSLQGITAGATPSGSASSELATTTATNLR